MIAQNEIHVQSRAVMLKEARILLCQTTGLDPNFYFLPGGHIEHGESASKALVREMAEEVGFEFNIVRFLGCMEYAFDPRVTKHAKCHTHEYTFIFQVNCAALQPYPTALQQCENHINLMWVSMDQLAFIDLRPAMLRNCLPQWLGENFNDSLMSHMV